MKTQELITQNTCEYTEMEKMKIFDNILLSCYKKLLSDFRELWYEEYLLSQRESCKNLHDIDFNNKIQINNIVLIKNLAKARAFWKLVTVTELFIARDVFYETHNIHLFLLELSLTHNAKKSPMPGSIKVLQNTGSQAT